MAACENAETTIEEERVLLTINEQVSRKERLRKFVEETSFYDVDLRRDKDREAAYIMELRLEKFNR